MSAPFELCKQDNGCFVRLDMTVNLCCLINNFRGLPFDELSCAAAVNSGAKVGQCGCLFSALSHSNPPAALCENVRPVSSLPGRADVFAIFQEC